MKTILLCGSMRFAAEMQTIAFQLEVCHAITFCNASTPRSLSG